MSIKSRQLPPDEQSTPLPEDALLKQMYENMVLARVLDERCYKLQRQGRIGFYAGSNGEEACQVGTALAMRNEDFVFASYRQPAVALIKGTTLQTVFDNLFGNCDDIAQGKQMPIHYSDRQNHFLSVSSVIGTQIVQAVGFGMASKIKNDTAVAVTYFGDGATSSNDFHSGMNFAATFKSPVVFCLVNNQFAISTPLNKQTGCAELVDKALGYGMRGVQVNGNDVVAVYEAMQKALEYARDGFGPTLLELKTYRRGPHSSSDDPSRYRDHELVAQWPDPLDVIEKQIQDRPFFSQDYKTKIYEQANDKIAEAIKLAESKPQPAWESVIADVYADVPARTQREADALFAQEKGLELTNEGEFPL